MYIKHLIKNWTWIPYTVYNRSHRKRSFLRLRLHCDPKSYTTNANATVCFFCIRKTDSNLAYAKGSFLNWNSHFCFIKKSFKSDIYKYIYSQFEKWSWLFANIEVRYKLRADYFTKCKFPEHFNLSLNWYAHQSRTEQRNLKF